MQDIYIGIRDEKQIYMVKLSDVRECLDYAAMPGKLPSIMNDERTETQISATKKEMEK